MTTNYAVAILGGLAALLTAGASFGEMLRKWRRRDEPPATGSDSKMLP